MHGDPACVLRAEACACMQPRPYSPHTCRLLYPVRGQSTVSSLPHRTLITSPIYSPASEWSEFNRKHFKCSHPPTINQPHRTCWRPSQPSVGCHCGCSSNSIRNCERSLCRTMSSQRIRHSRTCQQRRRRSRSSCWLSRTRSCVPSRCRTPTLGVFSGRRTTWSWDLARCRLAGSRAAAVASWWQWVWCCWSCTRRPRCWWLNSGVRASSVSCVRVVMWTSVWTLSQKLLAQGGSEWHEGHGDGHVNRVVNAFTVRVREFHHAHCGSVHEGDHVTFHVT